LLLTLERTILLELLVNLALILCVMTGVFFIGSLIQFLGKARELGLGLVLSAMPHLLPGLAAWTIPSSLLLATIMTYGRMSEDNEVTAIRAGGVPIYHVVVPALLVGMLLSGTCLLLNTTVIPASNQKRRAIVQDLLGRFRNALENAQENTYVFQRRRLSWHSIDDDGALIGLTLDHVRRESRESELLTAERARISSDASGEHLVFDLEGVAIEQRDASGNVAGSMRAAEKSLTFSVVDLLGRPGEPRPKELKLWDLIYFVERGPTQKRYSIRQINEEFHERLVLSLAPFVLALVGASLGVISRKGTLVTSFLLAFVGVGVPYYGIIMVGRALSVSVGLHAGIAFWPANLIMGIVGLVLLRKAVRG